MRNNESLELRSRTQFQESDQHTVERFVRIGLEIMSRGDYEGASARFRDGMFTANPGFDAVIQTGSISQVPNYESFREALLLSNMNSHFAAQQQLLVREFGDIPLLHGFYFNSRSESSENFRNAARRAQTQAHQVVSLNYAQVWLGVLHYLEHGEAGVEFGAYVEREAFIGAFLAEHRVSLDPIWESRHPYAVTAYMEVIGR